ncbi:hypothetical protein SteCoe_34104 [Stentor coeruleus]|uniref:Uncharacterized protein n=1 Tax=Stentor coeruleus TaxID=5963 RepID=A0A1R2AVH3_9CILI|nr:hypothetical protein SteCoe_34104 [Stentor coeruleus]
MDEVIGKICHLENSEHISDDYLCFSNSYSENNSIVKSRSEDIISESHYEHVINDFESNNTKYSKDGSINSENKDWSSDILEVCDRKIVLMKVQHENDEKYVVCNKLDDMKNGISEELVVKLHILKWDEEKDDYKILVISKHFNLDFRAVFGNFKKCNINYKGKDELKLLKMTNTRIMWIRAHNRWIRNILRSDIRTKRVNDISYFDINNEVQLNIYRDL